MDGRDLEPGAESTPGTSAGVDRLGKDECAEQVLTPVRLPPGCWTPSASRPTRDRAVARLLVALAPIVVDLVLPNDPTRLPPSMTKERVQRLVVGLVVILLAASAVGYLLVPAAILRIVGIHSNPQVTF